MKYSRLPYRNKVPSRLKCHPMCAKRNGKKAVSTHYSLMSTIFVTRAAAAHRRSRPDRIINKLVPPSRKNLIGSGLTSFLYDTPIYQRNVGKTSKSLRQNAFLLYFLNNKIIHFLLLNITGRLMFKFVNLFFSILFSRSNILPAK